ncbi:hypothetical protein NLU13_0159 [Sarocladium strictum]|uniref:non-specific serine/threonine protein kinase n=1 Tax=Sarocladium strictum TaxID=5046 RepID=A0AA39GNJ1_SARSR|nr:hypothetical protein NLU13_0159 [Sarocladium strictum]
MDGYPRWLTSHLALMANIASHRIAARIPPSGESVRLTYSKLSMMLRLWPLTALRQRPWPPSSAVAPRLDPSIPIEEECTPNYRPDRFYPAQLGQVLNNRYQIATKLGHGANSTIWLARDLDCWRWSQERYVAVKIHAIQSSSRRVDSQNEVDILKHVARVDPSHKGWHFIRKLHDSFVVRGPGGDHPCLVLEALREPLWLYRRRYVDRVVPSDILKILVQMMLHALDYLHSSCQVIHTDLKPDNVMIRVEDPAIFARDASDEFANPLPQKALDKGRVIYLARNNFGPLARPTGIIQLVDFDLAVRTSPGQIHTGAIQGENYRAPEVILDAGYTSSADIWSLGVMLWDLFEGRPLFDPRAPDSPDEYDEPAHLSQITALLGSPPQKLLSEGRRTAMFYEPNGMLKAPGYVPEYFTLDTSITRMSDEEKIHFIRFVGRMLRWSPEDRSNAKELLEDPWLYDDFS